MGVKIHKQKSTGDWYVWINHKGKRTSRKIGPDKRTAMKAATEYKKKLALGEVDFTNGRGVDSESFAIIVQHFINSVVHLLDEFVPDDFMDYRLLQRELYEKHIID